MPLPTRLRCRNLSPDGRQCPDAAVPGADHCYAHDRDRRRRRALRESPKDAPPPLEIPLLDSHAAIQVVCTDIARAIAAGTLDQAAARQINATLRIVVQTLPRPTPAPAASRKDPAPAPEAVAGIEITPEGEELAPATPYVVHEAKPERVFSLAELLYRTAHPEKADEPLPEAGYLDPESPTLTTTHATAEQNPQPIHQPQPGILPELQAKATEHHVSGDFPFPASAARRGTCSRPHHRSESWPKHPRTEWPSGKLRRMNDVQEKTKLISQPEPYPRYPVVKNGFSTRSNPIEVSYPCPGITRVSSGSASSRS